MTELADDSQPHRKRRRTFDSAGHAHFLTFSCFRRQPFLAKERTCRWTIDAIKRTRERHALHVWAYVLMPEHVQLVVWPTQPDYSIGAVLKTLKQSVATRALAYVRHSAPEFLRQMEDRQPNGTVCHRFWQRGGGFDRNLVEPKALLAAIEYVHAIPVRRCLCDRSTQWRWSSAAEYETPGSGRSASIGRRCRGSKRLEATIWSGLR
ncbi:MAG TPA: hypothetical protein VGN57_07955 [Pirellulaceae bacterium]|jgi:putative transposase|nr:hypothetical protein [Pirellulaceae bacterium]